MHHLATRTNYSADSSTLVPDPIPKETFKLFILDCGEGYQFKSNILLYDEG